MPPESPPRRGLKWPLVVTAGLAIVIVAAGIAVRAKDATTLRERSDAMAIPTVAVIAPGKAAPTTSLELPGRIEATARAALNARVSGYVKAWHADIGANVKAGQLLAEIETPELDQQLLQARAELANTRATAALAQTTAKRWQSLLATDSVSKQEADEKAADATARLSAVKALEANVERIEALKKFARIVAPFDGVVTSRTTDVGALVNAGGGPGSELFVVSDTRKLRVYVSVPQAFATAVQPGAEARLTVPERPRSSYTATVLTSARSISATSGAMLVQLSADNAKGELLPGSYASVKLPIPATAGTLTLPPGAVLFDKAGLRVATVDAAGKVLLKSVTLARDLGTLVEIAGGLAPEDRVIENPPDGIANGDAVRIAEAPAKAPAKP